MPNRLARESSPYLLQHSHNPVDWYPWGPEALARAAEGDQPILLSIGYSACHWCHVMAHESFEDPAIAAAMNRLFVNIKVDREERPDLDDVYQHANQLLGRQGGWPLTMFLTPAGVPFFGGTYFPNAARHGLPAFAQILEGVAEAYRSRRAEVEASGRQLIGALESLAAPPEAGTPTAAGWAAAVGKLLARVDQRHGGFGGAPKFPNTMGLEVLLRAAAAGDGAAAIAVHRALEAMADGGIHDQLGGGFHRYSVDGRWAVPHFEKMLYDNALLASLYLAAFQWSGNGRYREVALDIFGYLGREMTSPQGGLYSSQDADSPGPDGHPQEGAFFVWTPAQIAEVLGTPLAAEVEPFLGVTAAGNFEAEWAAGATVLSRHGRPSPAIEAALERLLAARSRRPPPARDDKLLASWNGLALSALCRGAQTLGEGRLLTRAQAVAAFVRRELLVAGGEGDSPDLDLRRSYLAGPSRIAAFAEDFALLAVGFLDLFETGFDPADLALARRLGEALLDRCLVEEKAAFAVAPSDGERLVHRPLSLYDNAIPSATSAGLEALQRLGWITGEPRFAAAAAALLRGQVEAIVQNPFGFGQLLCGLDRQLRGAIEVVIVGLASDPRTRALRQAVQRRYLPNRLLLFFAPGEPPAGVDPALWQGREQPAQPTAYVCRQRRCLLPVTTPEALEAALAAALAAST